VTLPSELALVGETFYLQGLIVDPGGSVRLGLTNAAELRIGLRRTN